MLTKNFYAFVAAVSASGSISAIAKTVDGNMTAAYGAPTVGPPLFANLFNGRVNPTGYSCTAFGNGKTPATGDDFNIESPLSNISITSQSGINISVDSAGISLSATFGVKNNDSVDVEVCEICHFEALRYSNASSNNSNIYLIDRTVLDTPIVIPPREVRHITYTIRLNYPTA